jgi:hypothetical protein
MAAEDVVILPLRDAGCKYSTSSRTTIILLHLTCLFVIVTYIVVQYVYGIMDSSGLLSCM